MKNTMLMNDFRKEYRALRPAILRLIDRVLKNGQYILNKNVERFEEEFARYVGSRYCVGVANGLEAIQLSLMGLGVGSGDEVITVANTDIATALAVVSTGATPVFVDIDGYYHMDPALIESHITKKTKAILPVHIYGQCVEIDRVSAVARKHNLFLVEDACQAHGATFRGRRAGSFGQAGCFSFYPTKNLGAYGDGGAITTNIKRLYDTLRSLRNRGQTTPYVFPMRGINSRLDELQAALLRAKLSRLDLLNRRRRALAGRYRLALNDVPDIQLPSVRNGAEHVFHLFVIRAKNRDKLKTYLSKRNITTLIHYPTPIHKQQSFVECTNVQLPNAERACREILSLPIHPYMTFHDVNRIAAHIKRFYQNR